MYKNILFLFLLLSTVCLPKQRKKRLLDRKKKTSVKVRVLLDQCNNTIDTWRLHAEKGFIIIDKKTKKKSYINDKIITVRRKGNFFFINGQKHHCIHITIKAAYKKLLYFNDKPYKGMFNIIHEKDKSFLINYIPLESYVEAVVRSEGWPGWPIEIDKVLAIASRSYVMHKVNEAHQMKKLYDVCDTNHHQRYNLYGIHDSSTIKKAVYDTKGMVLVYENKPILAMFDSCCGGVIPAYINDFAFDKAPYLKRNYACTFCCKCSAYKWHIDFNLDDIEKKLFNMRRNIKPLKSVVISKKDKAGLVEEIVFKNNKYSTFLTRNKAQKHIFNNIKSFYFDIKQKGKVINIDGYGLGHHIGLCQWGAREMVRQYYSYTQILSFYYPDTIIKRII